MRPFDPRLLRYARATWTYLATCGAVGIATAGLVIVQAGLLADALSGGSTVVVGGRELGLPIAIAGAFLARALLLWISEVAAVRSSAGVKSALRRTLLARVLKLGPVWLAGERRGEVVTLAAEGLDRLDAYFARYLPQLVLAAIVPLVVLARIVAADHLSALVVAVTLPLVPVFMVLVGLATRTHTQRRWRSLALLAHHFTDVVAGLPTLKIFGRAKAQAEEVRRLTDAYGKASMDTLRVAFLSSLVLELIASLSVALVAVGVGLRLVKGDLDLETALLVLLLAPEAYLPLRQMGAQFHASADGLAAAGDVFAILEAPDSSAGTGQDRPDLRGLPLRFVDISVKHPDRSQPALVHTSFDVNPHEIVALTGPSGCGKTTLFNVVLGFQAPTTGRVLVGETDVAGLNPTLWRQQLAWVPQSPHLPASTIGANVALGRPDADDAEIRLALRGAGAPGLDPARLSGQDGGLLSVGERRRVAIARALLVDAPVLLLDEPTAGLDDETEADVLAWLRRERRTVLVVSHRLAVLAAADRVIHIHLSDPALVTP